MNTFTPEIFDLSIGGYDYTVEFNREGLKEADGMGVTANDGMGLYDRTRIILYAGLKKNSPFISIKRAGDLLDTALDEGYGLDSFGDILDEFARCYKAVFIQSGGKTGKKLVSRRSEAAAKK